MLYEKIGIAGYMGSGKSCAAHFFAGHGWTVIDADREAKILMKTDKPLLKRVSEAFSIDGSVEGDLFFKKLGEFAFASRDSLLRLNSIVHPPLVSFLKEKIAKNQRSVLDAALIPLWNIERWFDCCIWVSAPFKCRYSRLALKYPGLSGAQLEARMRLQEKMMPFPEQNEWNIVENSGPIEMLEKALPLE